MFITRGLYVNDSAGDSKCVGCEDNKDGWCAKEKKWANSFKGCIAKKEKKPDQHIRGITGVYKLSNGTYMSKFTFAGKIIHVGTYRTEHEALTQLAKREVQLYGSRQRNKHVNL